MTNKEIIEKYKEEKFYVDADKKFFECWTYQVNSLSLSIALHNEQQGYKGKALLRVVEEATVLIKRLEKMFDEEVLFGPSDCVDCIGDYPLYCAIEEFFHLFLEDDFPIFGLSFNPQSEKSNEFYSLFQKGEELTKSAYKKARDIMHDAREILEKTQKYAFQNLCQKAQDRYDEAYELAKQKNDAMLENMFLNLHHSLTKGMTADDYESIYIDMWNRTKETQIAKGVFDDCTITTRPEISDKILEKLFIKNRENDLIKEEDFNPIYEMLGRLAYVHDEMMMASEKYADNHRIDEKTESAKNKKKSKPQYAEFDHLPETVVIDKLTPMFYNHREWAEEYLMQIKGQEPIAITAATNRFVHEEKKLDPTYRKGKLWRLLYGHGLYTCGENNWNSQLK